MGSLGLSLYQRIFLKQPLCSFLAIEHQDINDGKIRLESILELGIGKFVRLDKEQVHTMISKHLLVVQFLSPLPL